MSPARRECDTCDADAEYRVVSEWVKGFLCGWCMLDVASSVFHDEPSSLFNFTVARLPGASPGAKLFGNCENCPEPALVLYSHDPSVTPTHVHALCVLHAVGTMRAIARAPESFGPRDIHRFAWRGPSQ